MANGGLGFSDAKAGAVYGLYTAMVYLLCLGGGWVADRITGQRRAVLIGGILIAAGEFCLVAPSEASFYLGLVLLMMGTGLLKGNVSTIVGQLYRQGDPRRDSGFSIFYMGINIGALISPHHLRLGGREDQLAAGLRRGRHRHAGRPDSIRAGRAAPGRRRACIPPRTGDAGADRRQKRNAALAVGGGLAALRGAGDSGRHGRRSPFTADRRFPMRWAGRCWASRWWCSGG